MHLSAVLLTALFAPLACAQSSAPSSFSVPFESLAPSSTDPIVESLAPSAADTITPSAADTITPSAADTIVESSEPTITLPTGTIAQIVADDDRFGTLESLLKATDLLAPLADEGPFTLFAPTDDAFEALDLPEDTDLALVTSVLLYHVVPEEEVALVNGATHTTSNGEDVSLTFTPFQLKVNDANIRASEEATNGIIYVIDTVLIPPTDGFGEPGDETGSPTAPPLAFESLAPSVSEPVDSFTPSSSVSSAPTELPVPAPTPGAQTAPPTIAPTATDSTSPSATEPFDESSVPSATNSVAPSIAESTAPSSTPEVALPEPTPGAATVEPTSISSESPSGVSVIDSLMPSSVLTEVDPQCSAHIECLLEGLDDDCCPTSMGMFLDCCDLGDSTPTSAPPTPGAVIAEPSSQPSSLSDSAAPTSEGDTLGVEDPEIPVVSLTPTDYPGCMQVNGDGEDDDELLLATCNDSETRQTFKFVFGGQIQLGMDNSKCLQAGRRDTPFHGKYIRVFPCDSSNDLQIFTWESPEGRLYPTNYPDVTVVFSGTTPNVNSDRIILGDLEVGGVVDRQGWKRESAVL